MSDFFSKLMRFYRGHYILSHMILMVVAAFFIGLFALFFLDVWTNHGRSTAVPEVRKKSFEEAARILANSDLGYEISDSIYDSNLAPGAVKEVWPHPGSMVKPGRTVYLTINSFEPEKVTVGMPLTGVSLRQTIAYLESIKIKNVRIVYVPSNFPDIVEGARYKGKSIEPGTQIPVNASVVLEVGTVPVSTYDEDESYEEESGASEPVEDVSSELDIIEEIETTQAESE